MEAPFHASTYPTMCCKEIWVYPKMRVGLFSYGTLSQTPDLENFATASRCQQARRRVDDTYTTIDESWLF